MAVEAQHLNFFNTAIEPNIISYNGYGMQPLSGTTTGSLAAMFNNSSVTAADVAGVADTFPAQVAVKSVSGQTYTIPLSMKRPRESINPMMTCKNLDSNRCSSFAFLGDDLSLQLQRQQLEMDQLIAQHDNKIRREIEERRKTNSRRIISTIEKGIINVLKAKDDEIGKIGKLNWALQEKVKSLSVEGQIWRELAHTNEAMVQALRSNLEHVLSTQINSNDRHANDVAVLADDAQSHCGSSYREEEGEECGTRGGRERNCRQCGEGESSVLVLPCRHLCLCTVCGSSVHICPVCKKTKNASVQVIMSS